jgi:hypothetical protein
MPRRNERGGGEGCIGCMAIFGIILLIAAGCALMTPDSESDCYLTPGAQEGSAQYERDIQRCIDFG